MKILQPNLNRCNIYLVLTPLGIVILPANNIKSCYLISFIVILLAGSFYNIFLSKSAA